ncbi:MAG: alpha-galactosidase [Deltaproteobacteria bacterium]|nr:MAG: alpha-galactosidase [Deltaproteobacteria bacterium]
MGARPGKRLAALLAVALSPVAGCANEGTGEPPYACPLLAAADSSVRLRVERCDNALALVPRVRVDGTWRAATACEQDGDDVRCAVDGGTLIVALDEGFWPISRFIPDRPSVFGGFDLTTTVDLGGATTWLSNGFHSWSQSGTIALAPARADGVGEAAAGEYGDAEVLRTGETHSWWHTWVAGGDRQLTAGVLRARRFRSWITVGRADDGVRVRLVTGGVPADEVAASAGEVIEGEPWYIDTDLTLERYAALLRATARPRATPEAGWNSWYELWDSVDEDAVRANAQKAREILTPSLPEGAPPLRIVVDDGWQRAWGDWRPNDKFPSGLSGLAADLRADGFTVGVWLAPLLVDLKTDLAKDHPDWLVTGATYPHPLHGAMGVLDVTHPDARAHLQAVISGLVADGLDLLKIDFLFAGTFAGERAQPVTGMEAFRLALEAIREAAGEDTLLLAVGAPGVPVLPYVDAWRVGGDIALEPFGAAWAWLPNQARSVAARWPLCEVVLCDADPALMRSMSRNEVEAGAWIVAVAGGGFFLSDDLRALDAERPSWAVTPQILAAALSGEVTLPGDLVPADPPADLVNAIGDYAAGESRHVVPGVWDRLRLNTRDDERDIFGVSVPGRSAILR